MDTVKVIIQNWPEPNSLLNYMSIIIALLALFVSIYSMCITRKSFIASNRPFVWAANYGQNSTLIPYKVGYSLINSPATIKYLNISIILDNQRIFTHTEKNFIRLPDVRNYWSFNIGKNKFEQIIDRPEAEKKRLLRVITIKYSAFGGGKVYNFHLEQLFNTDDGQWQDKSSKAN